MANWWAYNKYKAKPVRWCLSCNVEVKPVSKPVLCPHCKKKPQFFASTKESKRYHELRLIERFGDITGLQCAPRFKITVNGKFIGTYVGDFSYTEKGKLVVEDVKSDVTRTDLFLWKKNLMEAVHGIVVREVY